MSLGVGNRPFTVRAADLNSDGKQDIVALNNVGGSITVYLGNGDGTFLVRGSYGVGSSPFDLIVEDFDANGTPDIAATTSFEVAVLKGVGDGSFAAAVSYDADGTVYGVSAADFNSDGILDLALANIIFAGRITLLFGQGSMGVGNGTFGAPHHFTAGEYPYHLKALDVNHDGKADVVCSNQGSGDVAVLFGDGMGNLTSPMQYPTGQFAYDVCVKDLNGDGNVDLVVANGGAGTITTLLGNATGSFSSPVNYDCPIEPRSVVAGDFTRDGIDDLAVADHNNGVALLPGLGNATFGSCVFYPAGPTVTTLSVADFDGNASPDLVAANFMATTVSVLLNCGETVVATPPVLTDVRDVPNDQGGRVFVTWLASNLDVDGGTTITGYRVWRRIPTATVSSTNEQTAFLSASRADASVRVRTTPGPDGTLHVTYWEALVTLPSQHLEGYGYTAPTTQDSMKTSNPYTAFFVSALTADPFVFFQSNIDSGYSVDNIGPKKPKNAMATLTESGVALIWNSTDDPDLSDYRVYRGPDDTFEPSEENLVASPADTFYLDATGTDEHVYKITAADLHGNESEYVVAYANATTDVTPGSGAASFAIHSTHPNPTRGDLVLDLSLPDSRPARVELVDVRGRRIWSQELHAAPGRQSVRIGGADRPAGIYLLRLVREDRAVSTKVAVIR